MTKQLSVCVPTFNRARLLKRTLVQLAKEITPFLDEVEICISDNASPDKTQEVVKDFKKKYPKTSVVYNRNKKNLGYDKNVLLAWRMGRGKYVWMMGDDDFLVPGAISRLLTITKKDTYDYILANFTFDGSERVHLQEMSDDDIVQNVLSDRCLITFIGSHVARRTIIDELPKKVLEQYSFAYIQLLIFLYARKHGAKIYVTRDAYIHNGADGGIMSVASLLTGYLRNAQTLDFVKKHKLLSSKEYSVALNAVYESFFGAGVVGFMMTPPSSREDFYRHFEENYCSYVVKSTANSLPIRTLRFLARTAPTFVFSRLFFRILYKYIFIMFLNIFRKTKKHTVWDFYEQKKKKGAYDFQF